MTYLNHTIQLLIGGNYIGNESWSSSHADADNCFKIYYVTKGTAFIYGDNQKYILEESKLYFINGNKMDSYACEGLFSTCWLHFVSKDLLIQHALLSTPVVQEISQEFLSNINILANISSLIESAKSASYDSHCLQLLQLQNFIQSIICQLLEEFKWDSIQNTKNLNYILLAVKYIDKNYCEQIRLKDLASLYCMSANYFHRLFTQLLQITPSNYIIQQRMNKAIILLKNQDLNVKEIAYQLGYCTDAYFSVSFKKYYGITPGEYQKYGDRLLFRTK